MPEYINTTKRNYSYAKGKIYRPGDIAILDKEYAESKPNSWMLLSEYEAKQRASAEQDALRETPEEKVKRLERELKLAKKAEADLLKAKEKTVDSEQNPELMKGKTEAPEGDKAPETPAAPVAPETTTPEAPAPEAPKTEAPAKTAAAQYQEDLAKAKELGYKGTGKKEEVLAYLKEKEGK